MLKIAKLIAMQCPHPASFTAVLQIVFVHQKMTMFCNKFT